MKYFVLFLVVIHQMKNAEALRKGDDKTENLTSRANGVSGLMRVEEQTKRFIRVSQLAVGDVIRGITGIDKNPAWCKVLALFPVAHGQTQTTYDGFTAGQMVVEHTVHPYGAYGTLRTGSVFTLATECDAVVNSAGKTFTPLSTAFCPFQLSWKQYLQLISSIRRLIGLTGNFWFNLNVYHDNETAPVPHWVDRLPQLCQELLQCSRQDLSQCLKLRKVMVEFAQTYLSKEYAEVVEKALTKIYGDTEQNEEAESTTVEHFSQGSRRVFLMMVVGATVLLVALILVVAVFIDFYRQRKVRRVTRYSPVKVQL